MDIRSIMIVDDSEPDQFLAESVIKKFDPSVKILQAYDGQEALEKLDAMEAQPSLILLDINMPRMNGFEFLEEYNKREEKAVVIAMLTSSDQNQDKLKATNFGCVQEYFIKPLQVKYLEDISKM